jgi:hypothetical protein
MAGVMAGSLDKGLVKVDYPYRYGATLSYDAGDLVRTSAICRPLSWNGTWQQKNLSLCPKSFDHYIPWWSALSTHFVMRLEWIKSSLK